MSTRLDTARSAIALLALVLPAGADTITVDANGGGDFLDLPSAVAAATSGDCLIVSPGDYSSFTNGNGITILGLGSVNVSAGSFVQFVPAGQRCTIAGMNFVDLEVVNSDGTIVLESLTFDPLLTPENQYLRINDCPDVRMYGCTISGAVERDGARLINVRMQISSSSISGGSGTDVDFGDGGDAGHGVICFQDSRLHLTRSVLTGGDGGASDDIDCPGFALSMGGDGGHGLHAGFGTVEAGTDVILAGRVTDILQGGDEGLGLGGISCDGIAGNGVRLPNGELRHSGVTFQGGGAATTVSDVLLVPGGTELIPVPSDPTFEMTGMPTPGGSVMFEIDGPPGSIAILTLGGTPTVTFTPGIAIESLVVADRRQFLGVVPPSGTLTVNYAIPVAKTQGEVIHAQVDVYTDRATILRTNSIPLILR